MGDARWRAHGKERGWVKRSLDQNAGGGPGSTTNCGSDMTWRQAIALLLDMLAALGQISYLQAAAIGRLWHSGLGGPARMSGGRAPGIRAASGFCPARAGPYPLSD